MAKWGLGYKGTEVLTPEEWNLVVDALNELDGRIKKVMGGMGVWSGNGISTVFEFTHNFGEIPTVVLIGEASNDAMGNKWWEADETKVTIYFSSPPPSGTNNVRLWYLVMKL
jgi:hypothetical protein